MEIAKIIPLRDFNHNKKQYEVGVPAYVVIETARRWERDGFAKIEDAYNVEELIELAYPQVTPKDNSTVTDIKAAPKAKSKGVDQ